MKTEDFVASIEAQTNRAKNLLFSKNDAYSPGVDRLEAFKKAAHLQGVTVQQALAGMMVKHTTALYDMIYSDQEFDEEVWSEKINDHINYLLLLRATLDEGWSQTSDVPFEGLKYEKLQSGSIRTKRPDGLFITNDTYVTDIGSVMSAPRTPSRHNPND